MRVFPLNLDNNFWQTTPVKPESCMDLTHREIMKSQVETAHGVSLWLSLSPVPGSGHCLLAALIHPSHCLPKWQSQCWLIIGIQRSWATLKTSWPQQLGPPSFVHLSEIPQGHSVTTMNRTDSALCHHGSHTLESCLFIVDYVPDIVLWALLLLPHWSPQPCAILSVLQRKKLRSLKWQKVKSNGAEWTEAYNHGALLLCCYVATFVIPWEDPNPLQYSCLKNSMDRRVWQAAVQVVAKKVRHEQLNAQRRLEVSMHFSHSLIIPNNLLDNRSSCHCLIEVKNRGSMIRWIWTRIFVLPHPSSVYLGKLSIPSELPFPWL